MSIKINNLADLSAAEWWIRASAVLPPWVALLLVLALAWQLGRLTWMLFPQEQVVAALPDRATAADTLPDAAAFDINRIVTAHLFGAVPDTAVEEPSGVAVENVEDTQLNLKLHGTIAATESAMAMAIIADDRGDEKVYAIGDTVAGGRTLHSVLPDRALLNNNGELEALRLPTEYESPATSRSSTRRVSRTSANPRLNAQLRQAIANSPAKLTDLIRPQPVFSNGKQLGYRVYPGRRRQQFVELGLKPGDLVTEINGTPLNDPAKGADIFRSLAESNQVTVTVERNGNPQVLVLDTDKLNLATGARQ